MDTVRAIDSQRLRLLRLLVGLVVALGFLSVGPVSRGFSAWVCGLVGSVLSRAELAGRYLVIAQARLMAARNGDDLEYSRFAGAFTSEFTACETELSPCDLRQRLKALQEVLMDLPRHALRLLRRIGKHMRSASGSHDVPCFDPRLPGALRAWRLAGNRIERPPETLSPSVQDL